MGKSLEVEPIFEPEPKSGREEDRRMSIQERATVRMMKEKGHTMEGMIRPLDWWYVSLDAFAGDFMKRYQKYLDVFAEADKKQNKTRAKGTRRSSLLPVTLGDFAGRFTERFTLGRHSFVAPELVVFDASTDEGGNVLGGGKLAEWKGVFFEAFHTIDRVVGAYNDREAETIEDPTLTEGNKNIVRPLVVSVSQDPVFQREALERGVQAIPKELSKEDTVRLLKLAIERQESEASLLPKHTQVRKNTFYEEHQGEVDVRAEITADTAQELVLLRDILSAEQTGKEEPLHVLDVGCGNGRISSHLAEAYRVTGIDGNETLLAQARERMQGAELMQGDIIEYKHTVPAEQYDAVLYTWHTLLEAYGVGNTLSTLTSAWHALKEGGMLVFDMPTRENEGMEDGLYGEKNQTELDYLAYLMTKEEIVFMLKMAGLTFERKIAWTTQPSSLFPEGMKKWTIVARK